MHATLRTTSAWGAGRAYSLLGVGSIRPPPAPSLPARWVVPAMHAGRGHSRPPVPHPVPRRAHQATPRVVHQQQRRHRTTCVPADNVIPLSPIVLCGRTELQRLVAFLLRERKSGRVRVTAGSLAWKVLRVPRNARLHDTRPGRPVVPTGNTLLSTRPTQVH